MTYVNDPIGDMLTRLRNAQSARNSMCRIPHSNLRKALAEVLKDQQWIQDVSVMGEGTKKEIIVTFIPGKTLTLSRVSKPGRRVYSKSTDLKPVLRGYGVAILTTSQGLMTDKDAKLKKLGGEVLCTIS